VKTHSKVGGCLFEKGRLLEGVALNRIIAVYVTTKVKSLIDLSLKNWNIKLEHGISVVILIIATCSEIARALLQYPLLTLCCIFVILYFLLNLLSVSLWLTQ